MVSVITNVSPEKFQTADFRTNFYKVLSETLQRPADKITVHLFSDDNFFFGDSLEKGCQVKVHKYTNIYSYKRRSCIRSLKIKKDLCRGLGYVLHSKNGACLFPNEMQKGQTPCKTFCQKTNFFFYFT